MYSTSYFRKSKFNNVRQTYDGYNYDSKFEARVAAELDIKKKAKQIKDWQRQFKVELYFYNVKGDRISFRNHKVDFRIEHNDGSFELLECKGLELADWKMKRDILTKIWLLDNLDYTYRVMKEKNYYASKSCNHW